MIVPSVWLRRSRNDARVSGLIDMGSDLLQRRPAEQEPLFAGFGEVDRCFCLVAYPLDVEDHTLAPLRVDDVVTDAQAERLGSARRRAPRLHRPLHDLVAVPVDRRGPSAGAERRPPLAPASFP